MNYFLGYLMLLCVGLMRSTAAQEREDHERLKSALFQNYDRDVLPFYDHTNRITLGMSLNNIRGLDLFEGTIGMNVWMNMNCSLNWGSWAYTSELISVTAQSDNIDTSNVDILIHPIWDIIDTKAIKHNITYECCTSQTYEDVTFSVTVRRRETHGRIASSVITTWLILIVFLIGPSSAGKRIFFAGFIFVALVVLSAALSAEIPGYSMTRLGRFIIVGMMIVAIVTIINGLIYRFDPKQKPGQLQEGDGSPPRALLVIDIGAFLGTAIILGISTGALFV